MITCLLLHLQTFKVKITSLNPEESILKPRLHSLLTKRILVRRMALFVEIKCYKKRGGYWRNSNKGFCNLSFFIFYISFKNLLSPFVYTFHLILETAILIICPRWKMVELVGFLDSSWLLVKIFYWGYFKSYSVFLNSQNILKVISLWNLQCWL